MQRFGARELRRVALWGLAAAAALLLAMLAATTDAGRRRLAATTGKPNAVAQTPPTRPDDNARQLAEAMQVVRALTADRDRLAARLDSLERNFGELTGSIRQQALASTAPPSAPAPSAPAPEPQAPALTPAAEPPPLAAPAPVVATPAPTAAVTELPATTRLPLPSAPPKAIRQEYGIDLGGAANVDAVRALWSSVRTRHGGLLQGLRPIVVVREHARRNSELRLVVGPFANAAAAARLCSVIAVSGAICQPALFEGQRLATR